MFGGIGTLFSGIGLAGIIFALILQNQEIDQTKKALKLSAELGALTALIQEADRGLARYERWENNYSKNETAKPVSDYTVAKKKTRDKLKIYRNRLEELLELHQDAGDRKASAEHI